MYVKGQWEAFCDTCGQKYLSGQMRKMWDNKYTCPKCFETRNPQELLRGKKDGKPPPWVRGSEVKGTESNILFPLSAETNIIAVETPDIFPQEYPFLCNIIGDVNVEMVRVLDRVSFSPPSFLVERGIVDTPKVFP